MGKIFDTQTYLRIKLSYTADVASDISSVKIKYEQPDGTTGEWTATHVPASKYVYYDLPTNNTVTLDEGKWHFWIYAVMNDARILIGEVDDTYIYDEGSNRR